MIAFLTGLFLSLGFFSIALAEMTVATPTGKCKDHTCHADPNEKQESDRMGLLQSNVNVRVSDAVDRPDVVTGAWAPTDIKHRGWEAVNECVVQQISRIMKNRRLTSVADYGAGNGFYAKRLVQLGLSDVQCYDGNVGIVNASGGLCSVVDLSTKQSQLKQVGLVYSLEVGEHIPKERETAFLDNLAHAASDTLILSWALPSQPGVGHVNCQPNAYVIEKMKQRGFALIKSRTQAIRSYVSRKCPKHMNTPNFKRTLMAFRKI